LTVREARHEEMEGFPSGQREQTVNLPALAFGGSNPPPSIPSFWEPLSKEGKKRKQQSLRE
jgi:hypothetical protein